MTNFPDRIFLLSFVLHPSISSAKRCLTKFVKQDHDFTLEILPHLIKVGNRKICRALGYSSMFVYRTDALGYWSPAPIAGPGQRDTETDTSLCESSPELGEILHRGGGKNLASPETPEPDRKMKTVVMHQVNCPVDNHVTLMLDRTVRRDRRHLVQL